MTTSDYKKLLTQLEKKQSKLPRLTKYNKPKDRSCGKALKSCRRCGRHGAHVGKYKLGLCRQCFREIAPKLGFKKYY